VDRSLGKKKRRHKAGPRKQGRGQVEGERLNSASLTQGRKLGKGRPKIFQSRLQRAKKKGVKGRNAGVWVKMQIIDGEKTGTSATWLQNYRGCF